MNNPERSWPPGGTFGDLEPERQRAYLAGLAHAYGSVFNAFSIESQKAETITVDAVLHRIRDQWDEVAAMVAVEGMP